MNEGRPTVMALVSDISERIYPVGRLDLDTEGLLLMTNDGDFAHRILHPSHEIQKTYIAWVEGQPNRREIQRLREGIEIEEGIITSAKVNQIGKREGQTQFKVIIYEGRKRQIRRMFHAVGHDVVHPQAGKNWVAFAGSTPDWKIPSLNAELKSNFLTVKLNSSNQCRGNPCGC